MIRGMLKLRREAWMEQALCAQVDPELFYADKGDWALTIRAKLVCQRCPVTIQCLQYAIDNSEMHGVWGGKTPQQRKELRRRGLAS